MSHKVTGGTTNPMMENQTVYFVTERELARADFRLSRLCMHCQLPASGNILNVRFFISFQAR
jgi:hypothetical protein